MCITHAVLIFVVLGILELSGILAEMQRLHIVSIRACLVKRKKKFE